MEKKVGYTPCYGADMKCLFQLLLYWEKDVVEVHRLLGRMFNCIWYRRKLAKAKTLEGKSLEQFSIDIADTELRELMRSWGMLEGDRNLIWSIIQRSV